ncbi:MAG: hydroxymethylbilane synthase, partial [Magnetovibrio sp.]|nr:hydroxymethylbilane synthase [Magnetovibrio sp.]
ERAFLAVSDGSCRTPIAAHAWYDGDNTLEFHGLVAKPDGSEVHEVRRQGPASELAAFNMGHDAGLELKGKIGPDFLVTASVESSPTTPPTAK